MLITALIVGVSFYVWSIGQKRSRVQATVEVPGAYPSSGPTLCVNGIKLEQDNIVIGPPSAPFELQITVENRNWTNYSNVWVSVDIPASVTNLFFGDGWLLKNLPAQMGTDRGFFTYHDRYVLSPTVVASYPPLVLKPSDLTGFGAFIEVYSHTNFLAASRVHFLFATNFYDRTHLTGAAAEKFLRERAGTNYAPSLLLIARK
jgi:hypothetical protein